MTRCYKSPPSSSSTRTTPVEKRSSSTARPGRNLTLEGFGVGSDWINIDRNAPARAKNGFRRDADAAVARLMREVVDRLRAAVGDDSAALRRANGRRRWRLLRRSMRRALVVGSAFFFYQSTRRQPLFLPPPQVEKRDCYCGCCGFSESKRDVSHEKERKCVETSC